MTIEKIKRLIKHLIKSFKISWRASKFLFSCRIIMELVSVGMPVATLYLSKIVLNTLGNVNLPDRRNEFIMAIIGIVAIQLFGSLMNRFNTYISSQHGDLVSNQIEQEMIKKINSLDISYFDNPEFYNELQNAMRDSQSLQSLTWIILSFIKSLVQLITNLTILLSLNVFLPFMFIILYIPNAIIDKYIAKKKYDWQRQRATSDRKLGYVRNILQSKTTAKDTRIFNVQDYFFNKYIFLWKEWFSERKKIDKQRMLLSYFASILPLAGSVILLIFVGFNIINGNLTIGDYSLYSGISSQFTSSISSLLGVLNQSYESEMRLTKYSDFLKWDSLVKNEGTKIITSVEKIEFKNVSFKYPSTDRVILKNISFTLQKNNSIALVGLNGSGKSTIVKLLLRLYDPDGGQIFVNGEDLKSYELTSYYKCIGVVFQDFCRYSLKLRESISLTNIDNINSDKDIIAACNKADLEIESSRFKHGIDTYLGKIFDPDGVELSGGQWQKLAIAQAYFKDSSVMIFDEPNSALDPDAEKKLFDKMKELGRDKCVLYVTHRLSSATSANQILVINNGTCCERGTHSELMKQGGLYADLFNKQAEHYKD